MPRIAARAAAKRTVSKPRPAPRLVAADKIELSEQEEAFLARLAPPNPNLTLDGAKGAYFLRMSIANRWKPETYKRQELDLGLFCRLDPALPIRDVNLTLIWRWIYAVRNLRLATQRSRFQTICQFLDWCVRKKLLNENPARLLGLEEKPWTSSQGKQDIGAGKTQLPNMEALIKYCKAANTLRDRHERVAAQLLVYCGMRSGEVRNLRAGDVDLLLGRIWVRRCDEAIEAGETTWDVKTANSRRTVPLPSDLRQDLEALCKGKVVTALLFPRPHRGPRYELVRAAGWLIKLVNRVCRIAQVSPVCPHGLRGTFASFQLAMGATLKDVSIAMGHESIRVTTDHYAGVAPNTPALRLVHPPDAA